MVTATLSAVKSYISDGIYIPTTTQISRSVLHYRGAKQRLNTVDDTSWVYEENVLLNVKYDITIILCFYSNYLSLTQAKSS